MNSRKSLVGIALSASLVTGVGVSVGAASAAGASERSMVSVQSRSATPNATTLPLPATGAVAMKGGAMQLNGGGQAGAPAKADRQLFPAWGLRLAVKAALQLIKKRSGAIYNKIVAAAKAGKGAFVKMYNALPGWVKKIMPGAAGALYDAVRWVLGI